MKDPTGDHEPTQLENFARETVAEICCIDGESWPCATIQKWRESKTFRIQQLDTLTDMLTKNVATLENKIATLDEKMRRTTAFVNAILAAHADHHSETPIDFLTNRGYIRTPGMTTTTVTYKDSEWYA